MMRMISLRISRWALAGLALALVPAASAAQVPQPRALEAALGRLDLRRDTSSVPISNDRFPLYFPVNRPHGTWRSADNLISVSVQGHGHSARRYRSISLELLFWNADAFHTGMPAVDRVMATLGLPDAARTAAAAMIDEARRVRDPLPFQGLFAAPTLEAREVAGMQVRTRSTGRGGHVFLHFTDADAPEARWPTRDDVERLHPHTHTRLLNVPADVGVFQEPAVLSLRCRAAGRDAFRCGYVLDNTSFQPGHPPDAFSGLFRRGVDGIWMVTDLSDPPPR